jgi:hypothetical protein
MARRDSGGLSTSRDFAGHCVGLMTNHAPPPPEAQMACTSRGAFVGIKGWHSVAITSSDSFATVHEAHRRGQ